MNGGRFILAALLAALLAHASRGASQTPARPKPRSHRRPSDEPDVAYGAYQRGHYVTAFREATRRVEEKNDPKAMTLLGELYADGLGVAERR